MCGRPSERCGNRLYYDRRIATTLCYVCFDRRGYVVMTSEEARETLGLSWQEIENHGLEPAIDKKDLFYSEELVELAERLHPGAEMDYYLGVKPPRPVQ